MAKNTDTPKGLLSKLSVKKVDGRPEGWKTVFELIEEEEDSSVCISSARKLQKAAVDAGTIEARKFPSPYLGTVRILINYREKL